MILQKSLYDLILGSTVLTAPITAKNGTDLPSTYPVGYSTMVIGVSQTGWPNTYGSVINYRLENANNRHVQYFFNTISPYNIYVRTITNNGGAGGADVGGIGGIGGGGNAGTGGNGQPMDGTDNGLPGSNYGAGGGGGTRYSSGSSAGGFGAGGYVRIVYDDKYLYTNTEKHFFLLPSL